MSSEPTNSSGLPGRSRPALSDLSRETTEEDLWNLDDELAERPAPQVKYPPQPRKGLEPVPEDEAAKADSDGAQEPQPESSRQRGRTPAATRLTQQESPLRRRVDQPQVRDEIGDLDEVEEQVLEETSDGVLRVIDDPEAEAVQDTRETPSDPRPAEPEPAEPLPPRQNLRRDSTETKRATGAPLSRPRLNRREVLGLATFAFTLLLAAIWVLTRFFSAFEFKSEFAKGPDFPIKGELLALTAADTYWREPVRAGEARDFARREVRLIPVLEITLDPAASSAGALLVIFRNSEGQPVGDSIRRSFAGGRFDVSGNASIAFPATDGFLSEGDFNAYRSGKGDYWTAEVFEGPSVDSQADQFKPLAPIPVRPKLR
jgi:hypothetical protein